MKKRLFSLLICILCASALCVPSFALELYGEHPPRVVDDADLLTSYEEQQLTSKLDEISERQQFDVVVVTANYLGGKTPMEYADDYYDYNGYGYGADGDGALLLISMEDRDWWISTKGQGIEAFSDSDIDYVGQMVLNDLSNGNYYDAFCIYAQLTDTAVESAKNGYSGGFSDYDDYDDYGYGEDDYYYDGGSYGSRSSDGMGLLKRAAAALIGGFIIALIITGSMKNKLTSVRFKSGAADYTKNGSMNVTNASECFLYSTVTKTKKPEPESRSGGGSHSTHTSSSGSSHGGGGGKF